MKISSMLGFVCYVLISFIAVNAMGQTSKSSAFYEYQTSRSFKGVKFGATIRAANSILNLVSYDGVTYNITNPDYKVFNSIRFQTAFAFFNRDDRMYLVELYNDKQTISDYLRLKSSLRMLFGENDREYYINDKTSMNMTWQGDNMSIVILFSASFGRIYLTITDERIPHTLPVIRDNSGVPKI